MEQEQQTLAQRLEEVMRERDEGQLYMHNMSAQIREQQEEIEVQRAPGTLHQGHPSIHAHCLSGTHRLTISHCLHAPPHPHRFTASLSHSVHSHCITHTETLTCHLTSTLRVALYCPHVDQSHLVDWLVWRRGCNPNPDPMVDWLVWRRGCVLPQMRRTTRFVCCAKSLRRRAQKSRC